MNLDKNTFTMFMKITNIVLAYRKIPNISQGVIEVRKHFLGAYIRGGLYSGGLIFGGHFVLVSEYQDLEIHRYISLLFAKKVFL